MTHQIFWLIGLFLFLPLSPPAPAHGHEIWEGLQRQQRRRESDRQWERLNRPAPSQSNMQGNEPGVQELHGVVNQRDCYDMERNFRRQGRRIKLVGTQKSTNPGAVLRWMCIFQGEDAETGWYDERRY